MAYPITAYALSNALGTSTAAVVDALRAGRGGLRPRGEAWFGEIATRLAPLPPRYAAYEGPQARIAWHAVRQILAPVRAAVRRWSAARVAVVIGTSTGGIATTEHALAHHATHGALPDGFDLDRHHALASTAELVAAIVGARGPTYVVSSACASGAKTFGCAKRLLDLDRVDAALVGGVDSLCALTERGFATLQLLSASPCRPLSATRDGISLGEGGALALIEREAPPASAGPRVTLLAVGESQDAHDLSAPDPRGEGARLAMERALVEARLTPIDVDLVHAHATGTRLNDAAEARAIRALFARPVPVLATKGYTGHLLGAAGATEVLLTVLAMEHGFVPASLGCAPLDPTLGLEVVTERREAAPRAALCNAFAFGGSNAAVLLGRVAA